MWEYSNTEYVKLFRKMLNWEWYTDINTKVLFLHCLLKANWKDGAWHGHTYKRGQFITSLPSLSKETGLSIQQVRTALKHLKSTGELTVKNYSKFRVITVVSYDSFQGANRQTNSKSTGKSTVKQQATNRQSTADIRTYKNSKNIKEDKEEVQEISDEQAREWGWID